MRRTEIKNTCRALSSLPQSRDPIGTSLFSLSVSFTTLLLWLVQRKADAPSWLTQGRNLSTQVKPVSPTERKSVGMLPSIYLMHVIGDIHGREAQGQIKEGLECLAEGCEFSSLPF